MSCFLSFIESGTCTLLVCMPCCLLHRLLHASVAALCGLLHMHPQAIVATLRRPSQQFPQAVVTSLFWWFFYLDHFKWFLDWAGDCTTSTPILVASGSSFACVSTPTSFALLTEQENVSLLCLLVASNCSLMCYVGYATGFFGTNIQVHPHVFFILDHLSYNSWSSTLTFVRTFESQVHVLNANCTLLPVTSSSTHSTSLFHVPFITHVPWRTKHLIFCSHIWL